MGAEAPARRIPEDLASLIAQAQAGDEAAFRTIVGQYKPFLSRLARRRLRSGTMGSRPSDLVQDTLERAVRCLQSFQGTRDPELRAWLAKILQNVLIQQHRAAGRIRRAASLVSLPSVGELEQSDPQPGPSEQLHGQEAWRSLLRAVAVLPEGQREAVRRHLRGTSVAEIAQLMGKTPAAVSCLLQRGGKALQSKLQGAGPLGGWFRAMQRLLEENG